MELHFDQELAQLKEQLLRMSALAEQDVAQVLKALISRDAGLVKTARALDDQLDHLQMEIDDRCVKLLALRQPMARDLRFLIVAMKIAAELERIGDQADNIAEGAEKLLQEPPLKPLADMPRMGEMVQGMIHAALDAFVYGRVNLAREVIARDDRVDLLNAQIHRDLTGSMIEDQRTIPRVLNLMRVSHNLERIADHATNIAEEVVYLYEARDIRHQHV